MKFLLSAILAAGIFALVGAWYRWDAATNHGWRFGYYGDFNRVSNALVALPGVTITQSWKNCGLSLREFGFGLWYSNAPAKLDFTADDGVRTMGPEEVKITCFQRIRAELKAALTNPPAVGAAAAK